jgi:hypothetical protein
MIEITREVAFRLAEGATESQVDPVTGRLHEPELIILERQRPDQAPLTKTIRGYLEAQIKHCEMRRRDAEAVRGLAEALQMAARLLTAQEVKEGQSGGPIASTRSAFLSLAATLLGETLPESQPMRLDAAVSNG